VRLTLFGGRVACDSVISRGVCVDNLERGMLGFSLYRYIYQSLDVIDPQPKDVCW
jgi:hypothetical protein